MARKQSDYLAALLAGDTLDGDGPVSVEAPAGAAAGGGDGTAEGAAAGGGAIQRARATTLIDREAALARIAGGQVRQVTQLLLDPAKVRVWPGNPRAHALLAEENCRDLIDSMIAEGGQKVPALVRRVAGDPAHDYEVIVGTRRHWAIAWLRANSYPDMRFVAQVVALDDEAAFRLADLENRARTDVSDLERARNYLDALRRHYGNHQGRMAERLRLSRGWLSKMLKVAALPDAVVAAFASPADIQLKPGYALAQAMDDAQAAKAITAMARTLAADRRAAAAPATSPDHSPSHSPAPPPALGAAAVMRRLLDAARPGTAAFEPYRHLTPYGRPVLSVQSANRQGVTVRLHAGSGADADEVADALRAALAHLDATGRGLRR